VNQWTEQKTQLIRPIRNDMKRVNKARRMSCIPRHIYRKALSDGEVRGRIEVYFNANRLYKGATIDSAVGGIVALR